jgi:carbonic anhydrase
LRKPKKRKKQRNRNYRRQVIVKKILALMFTLSLGLTLILGGCGQQSSNPSADKSAVSKRTEIIKSPDEAKKLLVEGNERFTTGKLANKDLTSARRDELVKNGQHPFAVIVSCSDSRVPPELLFDQALGDLFVVRVAGNVISPVELGSVEYAVEHLKAPLVVVLGHEKCGAVTAAVQGGEMTDNIEAIVNKIKPAVDKAKSGGASGDDLIEKSADFNVENALADISKSNVIKEAVEAKYLSLLGTKYDLDTGTVAWFNQTQE